MKTAAWARAAVAALSFAALGACANAAQREAAYASQFAQWAYPKAERGAHEPEHGVRTTGKHFYVIYKEAFPTLQGARIETAAVSGSKYRLPAGATLSLMNGTATPAYCTTKSIRPGEYEPGNGGCLIDRDGNGTFDGITPLGRNDGIIKDEDGRDLDAPVAYETVRLAEPEFASQMEMVYRNKSKPELYIAGARTKGDDLKKKTFYSADEVTDLSGLAPDTVLTLGGVQIKVHAVGSETIDYTILGGQFRDITFVDEYDILTRIRRPI